MFYNVYQDVNHSLALSHIQPRIIWVFAKQVIMHPQKGDFHCFYHSNYSHSLHTSNCTVRSATQWGHVVTTEG